MSPPTRRWPPYTPAVEVGPAALCCARCGRPAHAFKLLAVASDRQADVCLLCWTRDRKIGGGQQIVGGLGW